MSLGPSMHPSYVHNIYYIVYLGLGGIEILLSQYIMGKYHDITDYHDIFSYFDRCSTMKLHLPTQVI